MDLDFAKRFAAQWAAEWNSHDLDRVLVHYTADVVFASPLIVQLMGDPSGEVRGRKALRAYWAKALEMAPDLHFTVEDVRVSVDSIVINFRNQRGQPSAEVLTFRGAQICRGFGARGLDPG
jgi:ketosteroid isomerase-like protein